MSVTLPSTARIRTAALSLIVFLLLMAAHARNTIWQDRVSPWLDAAGKSSNKARVRDNLGQAYSSLGLIQRAREQYALAALLDPEYAEAHFNLGSSYLSTNDLSLARREFELALQKTPDMKQAERFLKYTYLIDSPR